MWQVAEPGSKRKILNQGFLKSRPEWVRVVITETPSGGLQGQNHMEKRSIPSDFPGGLESKESACQCKRPRFHSCVGKIPWRRKWLPTPVFLPGKSHGQRSLVGYSP